MVPLSSLWLPILLAAIIVFIASSIMHTVLKYHQSDYRRLPQEDKLLAEMRSAGLTRGMYIFPFSLHKEMKTPTTIEKYKQGPVGMMTVFPSGPPAMPKFLIQWFVFCVIIGVFVAYLTGRTVAPGASYLIVFRVAGCSAFMAYGLGHISDGIWKGQTWSATTKEVLDGLVYALLTAGTFGWLWPR